MKKISSLLILAILILPYIAEAASTPLYVAAGAVNSGTATVAPALPAGIISGDILILVVETSNQTVTISNQNGGTWTQFSNSPQGTGTAATTAATNIAVYWSRYNGTQGAPTVADSGDHDLARIIAVRGALDSGDPTDVTAGSTDATANTSASIPGATTSGANELVISVIGTALPDASGTANFSAETNSDLADVTELVDNTVTAGVGGGIAIVYGTKNTAGTYGSTAVTLAASSVKAMMTIALKPSSTPPAPWFVAAGAVTSGTGTVAPALPAGLMPGDILVLPLETSNQAISISNQNGGTWTQFSNSPQSTGTGANTTSTRLTVFWARYNGTQGAPTATDSGDHDLGRMIAIRGLVTSGDPTDVTAGGVESVADTSASIPGATTSQTNDYVVGIIGTALPDSATTINFSGESNSDLSGLTELTDNTVTAGVGGGLGILGALKTTAGTFGNTSDTVSSSSVKALMNIALLAPQAVTVTAPTVTTDSAQSFTSTSGRFFGSITNTGGETGGSTDKGFAISTNSSLSSGVSTTSLGSYSGTGSFNVSSTTLVANTTYYFRAYASNSGGTGFGTIKSFTLGNDTPARKMRLFEGYKIRILSGTVKLLQQ